MYNDDLKRFYRPGGESNNKRDFVRYNDDGTLGVKTSDIDSGDESSGKVLVTDGSGSSTWAAIVASLISSGTAGAGTVLTSNGEGGTTWAGFAAGITFADENDDGNVVLEVANG